MRRIASLLFVVAVLGLAGWTIARRIAGLGQAPLPVLGTVPPFALVGTDGETVTDAALRGRVWVADFIFTTCPGTCPILSAQLAKVARANAAAADVRLVSFSVDPAQDTPAAMRAYSERYGADPQQWLFLTGSGDVLQHVIRDGFRLAMDERNESAAGERITHSDRFALVDRQMRIRAYYHGADEGVVNAVLDGIERLRAEG